MRVTFARDMKVDEAMATPLQERLYASHAPHFPSVFPSTATSRRCSWERRRWVHLPPFPLRRLSRAKCNKAATFTWTCELRLPLTKLPQQPPAPACPSWQGNRMSRCLKGSMEACGLRCLRLCLRLCLCICPCELHLIKSWALFLKMLAKAFVAHTRTYTQRATCCTYSRGSRDATWPPLSLSLSLSLLLPTVSSVSLTDTIYMRFCRRQVETFDGATHTHRRQAQAGSKRSEEGGPAATAACPQVVCVLCQPTCSLIFIVIASCQRKCAFFSLSLTSPFSPLPPSLFLSFAGLPFFLNYFLCCFFCVAVSYWVWVQQAVPIGEQRVECTADSEGF